jgi:Glycosyl hydrolase family 20, catalytic domain/Glycosyl hydrolase family 20, domain 2
VNDPRQSGKQPRIRPDDGDDYGPTPSRRYPRPPVPPNGPTPRMSAKHPAYQDPRGQHPSARYPAYSDQRDQRPSGRHPASQDPRDRPDSSRYPALRDSGYEPRVRPREYELRPRRDRASGNTVRRMEEQSATLNALLFFQRAVTFLLVLLAAAVVLAASLNTLPLVIPGLEATNPQPRIVPAVREWQGATGDFTLTGQSRVVVNPAYAADLTPTGQALQADIAAITGHKVGLVVADTPASGDLFLTLGNADKTLGSEGYLMQVGDFVVISGQGTAGVAFGTRTALQILTQSNDRATIPKGLARDYPTYPERGMMLDVARKFIPLAELENYVRMMSWYKLDDLRLHLNDNVFGGGTGDWLHNFAAFRLNSPKFPGLAAKDGSYSEQDIRQLVALGKAYGVTITPEIDAPAHALALTQYRPDLVSPYSNEFLNISDPATYTFLESLWSEFLPWFGTNQVSIGADEYATGDANNYRTYIDKMDAFLKSKGVTTRFWGSLGLMGGTAPVNNDAVVELWDNRWQNPITTVKAGFDVINANDINLYIVPHTTGFHDFLDTRTLYDRWAPNIFDFNNPSLNLAPTDPHLLGAMFCDWNDMMSAVSDADLYQRIQPPLPVLGQKMWGGPSTGLSYDAFEQLAGHLGAGPGVQPPK